MLKTAVLCDFRGTVGEAHVARPGNEIPRTGVMVVLPVEGRQQERRRKVRDPANMFLTWENGTRLYFRVTARGRRNFATNEIQATGLKT